MTIKAYKEKEEKLAPTEIQRELLQEFMSYTTDFLDMFLKNFKEKATITITCAITMEEITFLHYIQEQYPCPKNASPAKKVFFQKLHNCLLSINALINRNPKHYFIKEIAERFTQPCPPTISLREWNSIQQEMVFNYCQKEIRAWIENKKFLLQPKQEKILPDVKSASHLSQQSLYKSLYHESPLPKPYLTPQEKEEAQNNAYLQSFSSFTRHQPF